MYIVAEFIGDDRFIQFIDTNKLAPGLQQEVETKVKKKPYAEFFGGTYFKNIQQGFIGGVNIFPLQIEGAIMVYLD